MDNNKALAKLADVAKKLLDLGKTNQLVNLKTSGTRAVELLIPSSTELFNALREDATFTLLLPQNVVDKKSLEKIEEHLTDEDLTYDLMQAPDGLSTNKFLPDVLNDKGGKVNELKAHHEQDALERNSELQTLSQKRLTPKDDEDLVIKTECIKDNTDSDTVKAKKDSVRLSKDKLLGIGFSKEEFKTKFGPYIKRKMVLPYTANIKNCVMDILVKIAKTESSSLEENGVNVLFVAVGVIQWFEQKQSDKIYKAPLLLIPASLHANCGMSDDFKLQGLDDEVIVNPTFKLKMLQEFNLELPEFGQDDTLEGYFQKVSPILEKAEYTLLDEVVLGVFSFVKISMYQDLMAHGSEILKSADVCSILGEVEDEAPMVRADAPLEVDDSNALVTLHNVVDADATQLAAIKMAASGQSFVLQGPPGTGKSQTITNIIAEILAQGRKVLFVSEKQAALKVVYNKMKKVGLEDFCLEIHSSKVNKKDVINEVCRTLKLNRVHLNDKAERDSSKREFLIEELEGYEQELHAELPDLHQSLYELYEEFWCLEEKIKSVPDSAFYELQNVAEQNLDYVDHITAELQKYGQFLQDFGDGADVRLNPWYGMNESCQNEADKRKFLQGVDTFAQNATNLKVILAILKEHNLNCNIQFKQLFEFKAVNDMLQNAKFANALDLLSGGKRLTKVYDTLAAFGAALALDYKELKSICSGDFANFKAPDCEVELKQNYKSGLKRFISSLFGGGYKKILTKIAALRTDRKKLSYEESLNFCKKISSWQQRLRDFNEQLSKISELKLCDGFLTDWKELAFEIDVLKRFSALNLFDGGDDNKGGELFEKASVNAFGKSNIDAKGVTNIVARIASILEPELEYWHSEEFRALERAFNPKLVVLKELTLSSFITKAQGMWQRLPQFDLWRDFLSVQHVIEVEGLLEFINTYGQAQGNPLLIADYFKYSWLRSRIEHVIAQNKFLSNFSAIDHDRMIKEFKVLDKNIFKINCIHIRSLLSAKRPDLNALVRSSPVYEILREGQKKSRLMNVRDFISRYGSIIMELKPCFLMSPLSVSTYLTAQNGLFDTVIFDEASQIFAQDALGAIYRGKQIIVVGDSRQMPPINFFGTSFDGDNDNLGTDISDFESILDLCVGSFKNLQLNWHYRSRFEELIAFSNKYIYEGRLVSFPSPISETMWNGVSYRYVPDAVYQNNVNLKEAQAVVDAVVENFKKFPQRSLGVVTFSMKQQEVIERLLERKRTQYPELEEYFSTAKEEPFFGKW